MFPAPILVPLDGSHLSESALPYAMTLARHLGCPLYLLRVTHQPKTTLPMIDGSLRSPDEQVTTLRRHAMRYLQNVVERYHLHRFAVQCHTSAGQPSERIAQLAEMWEAKMIVMATHARTGMAHWTFGSVTEEVLHQTQRPLLILPPSHDPLPASPSPIRFQRLLVPLDGTPLSENALGPAAQLANAYQAPIILFRALQPLPLGLIEVAPFGLEQQWWNSLQEEASNHLQRHQRNLQSQGIVTHSKVGTHLPSAGILQVAAAENADLIVMATHARKGLQRMLMGSVTEQVVQGKTYPVLVIRPTMARERQRHPARHAQSG